LDQNNGEIEKQPGKKEKNVFLNIFFLADKNWFEDLLDLYRYLIIKMLLVGHKL